MKRIFVIATLVIALCGLGISAPLHGFTSVEIQIIKDWFVSPNNLAGLPPGLARKEKLPPGLEKQLRKNGTLPPGLQKKVQALPPALEVKLPKLPDGIRRVIISGTVILLDTKLNKILDLIPDVH